jgi:4-amino-4-deoxy-L-arabinose transferase-like glycosyltransferase
MIEDVLALLKKKYYLISFLLILIFAFILRFYKLGQVPKGMTWDEAAIGYTGYSILTTRRDEWLNRLPISFMSFGDYKAPLAIYLNGFFTYVFGMNLWAVRLPFALASIFAIAGFMLLTNLLFKNKKLAIISGLLLTLSPWHIHFSRAGFESGMALSLMIWGLYFFIKAFKHKKNINYLFSSFFLVLSLYTYHSSTITIPIIIFLYILINKIKLKKIYLFLIVSFLLSLPLINDSFFGQGLARSSTLVFSDTQPLLAIWLLIKNFAYHLSPSFLISGATTTLRHGDGKFGVLFPVTLFLVFYSLFSQISFYKAKKKISKNIIFALTIALAGILPAALGKEVPHSNRALLALPGFLLLATAGFKEFIKNKTYKKLLIVFILIYFINFTAYLNNYFNNFAKASSDDFKEGYLEAFYYVKSLEKEKDKIIFTSDYGQPYIYALFVKKTNPIWYQGGSLIKYEFKDNINAGDLSRNNTVVVASNTDDIPIDKKPDKTIYGSDGSIRFKIFVTK